MAFDLELIALYSAEIVKKISHFSRLGSDSPGRLVEFRPALRTSPLVVSQIPNIFG